MPARTDNQSAHNPTHTPAAQRNIRKRQRVQAEDARAFDDRNDSYESDDTATMRAKVTRAQEEYRESKRLRKVEADLKVIDERQNALERGYEESRRSDEAERTTMKGNMSRCEESLKQVPTLADVERLVDAERGATRDTLKQSAEETSTKLTAMINDSIKEFQEKGLKFTLTNDLAPVTDRIDAAETSLNTFRDALAKLGSEIEQRPSAEDVENHMALESKKREHDLTKSNGIMSMKFATQLNTRITTFKSDLEKTVVPRALDPLRQQMHNLSGICNSAEAEVLQVANLQETYKRDHEWRCKMLEKENHDSKASFTKYKKTLDTIVDGLRQDLRAERHVNMDMKKSIDQLQTSRVKDQKISERKVDGLRNELHVEREERKSTEAKYEVVLQRLQSIEQQVAATRTQVNHSVIPKLSTCGADFAELAKRLEKQAGAVEDSTTRVEKDLQGKIEQQRSDILNHIDNMHSASHMDSLCDRVAKFETAFSQVSTDQVSEVVKVQTGLANLKEMVEDLLTTKDRPDSCCTTLQQSVNKYLDTIIPIAADIAILKDQHNDHVVNYKSQICEQFEIAKDYTNIIGRALQSRIHDQGAGSLSHLSNTPNLGANPVALEPQMPADNAVGITRLQGNSTAPTAQATDLAARTDQISTSWAHGDIELREAFETFVGRVAQLVRDLRVEFTELKICAAEDLKDLEAQQVILRIRIDNLEANHRNRVRYEECSWLSKAH